jgi:predicted esterase
MKRFITSVLALTLALAFQGLAAPSDSMQSGSTRLSDGTTMVFRLYVPRSYTKTNKYPIVVTLHGVGEKGADNRIQVDREDIVFAWMQDSVQKKYAPFILSPQCPSSLSWAAADGSAGVADNGVVKVLDSLKAVYSLDTNRFYCAGLSMGGAGTWGMVKSYPQKFAAVLACAGAMGFNPSFSASMIDGANTAKTPYWAFYGISDPTVDVMYSRRIDTAVIKAGFPVIHYTSSAYMTNPTGISTDSLKKAVIGGALNLYSEIINGDHRAGWMEAWHNPFTVPWLFSKSKVNGNVVFTWPAPGVQETTSLMIQKGSPHVTGNLRVAKGIIRWSGVSSPMRCNIYSAKGALVKRYEIRTNEGMLDCSGLAKGVYIIKANAPNRPADMEMTVFENTK